MTAKAHPFRLKQVMRLRKMTAVSLARRLHYHPATVHTWVRGRCQPSFETLIAMCRVLQVLPTDLFDLDYDHVSERQGDPVREFSIRIRRDSN
jgi:transcriptional regulator with XRE-family HTH domain